MDDPCLVYRHVSAIGRCIKGSQANRSIHVSAGRVSVGEVSLIRTASQLRSHSDSAICNRGC
jgi:hypothetical protein